MNTLAWFKSSYSSDAGGDCLEVALEWHKSSHSSDAGGACIEVAACPAAVHVRDSKDIARPALAFAPAQWSAFVRGVTARAS
jgi:hypothetical protein